MALCRSSSIHLGIFNRFLSVVFGLFAASSLLQAAPNIEHYGQKPSIRSLKISPSGDRYAFIKRDDEYEHVVIYDAKSLEATGMIDGSEIKVRSTRFLSDRYLLVIGSDTRRNLDYKGPLEATVAFVYELATGKLVQMFDEPKHIHPFQSGLSHIVGFNPDEGLLYMPAYDRNGIYNLYKVSISSGSELLHAKGNKNTRDWFVGSGGRVLARTEHDQNSDEYLIRSKTDEGWQQIYAAPFFDKTISIIGVSDNEQALLARGSKTTQSVIVELDLRSGELSEPIYGSSDKWIDDSFLDADRKLEMLSFSGLKPSYQFLDDDFKGVYERLQSTFPGDTIHPVAWTNNWQSVVIFVTGGRTAGAYYRLDTDPLKLTQLGKQYAVESPRPVNIMRYKARDGLAMTAVLTMPESQGKPQDLPLLVIPHGGPVAHDSIHFDWFAQYFAAKGYLVLQPNYRGSSGFGTKFTQAGVGGWGSLMQDDISDGVQALVKGGYVDPKRVCIMGFSYGGYAALAGGAFTNDLYRCIVSINGVSDLDQFVSREKYSSNRGLAIYRFWNELMVESELEKRREVSPANFASDFQAPVLLVHSSDDTTVHPEQTEIMLGALQSANKMVEHEVLEDEDHWMSRSQSRIKLLNVIDRFLNQHNPVH